MTVATPGDPTIRDPQRPGSVGTILSWVAILGVVGFVGVRNWFYTHTPAVEHAADAVELQIASRTAVGYRSLIDAAGVKTVPPEKMRDVTNQAVALARSPREKLRAVTVIGEMLGAPAALDELQRLKPELNAPPLDADAAALRTIYARGVSDLAPEARQQLASDLGWHGQLALSFQTPAGDPSRQKITSSSLRAVAAVFALEAIIAVAVLTGVVLLTITIVRLVDGKVRFAYQPRHATAGPFLEAFALYLVGYVGFGWLLHALSVKPDWLVYPVDLIWVIFAACWPLLRGVSLVDLKQGLGWHQGHGVFREALAGIGGYLAGMPFLALAIYTTGLLSKLSGEKAIHPIVFGAGGGPGAIIGLYLLASLWAPVVEETMFRGALFNYLRSGHRWVISAVLSGVIFAALHPQGWTAIPVLATIGIVFAGIREWRGTVIASGVAHALNNAVATTVLILVLG